MLTTEETLKILEDINKGSAKEDTNTDFGTVKKMAIIQYKGLEGRIVWDYGMLYNELTFVDNATGKHFSLGKSSSDSIISTVFHDLAISYEKNEQCLASQVVIIFDSNKVKEATEKLYEYIKNNYQINAIIMDVDEYKYLKEKNQIKANKEIIMGHHYLAYDMITVLGKNKLEEGIYIGFDKHTCVLVSERSAYPVGQLGKMKFGILYQKKMKEYEVTAKELNISLDFDEDKKTIKSMYDYLLVKVVGEKYLDKFFELDYIDKITDKEAELCDELQNNPICKKYITSELLEKICNERNFFTNKGKKTSVAWRDLYKLDDWYIQRYWIKDYGRIINFKEQKEAYGTIEQILCPILEYCRREELKEKIKKRDWGIVFCGGGGKGAYQIGVWKWLEDQGIADKITGVSGASVGALNSLLFVEGNSTLAEEAWNNAAPDIIVKQNRIPFLQNQDSLNDFLEKYMKKMKNICTSEKLVYSSITCVKEFPWKALLGYLQKGEVPNTSTIKADYCSWASRKEEEIKEIVLASAAIPGIKQSRQFEGREYVDGGFADNVPVRPLVEDGFRNIIIIYLDGKDKNEKAFCKAIGNLDVENVNFYHVQPSENIGNMLIAGAAPTKKGIEIGYKDAANQLQKILLK